LIRNHLTMSLYNHAAIWEDGSKMAGSYFCNGYLMLNSDKMSKSTGNFLTIKQCIEKFGADATRIAFADAGDTLDDANFDVEVANSAIMRLYVFEEWVQNNLKASIPEEGLGEEEPTYDTWDKLFLNQINQTIKEATHNYDEIKFKVVLKEVFF